MPHVHEHTPADAASHSFFDLFEQFTPRAQCMNYEPDVIWTHVVSDSLIALAYFCIPLALVYFVRRRRDLAFNWMFLLFALFIVLCGTTHLFGVWAIWQPLYRLDGLVKFATAVVSIATAVLLWRLLPTALSIPTQADVLAAKARLDQEVEARVRSELALEKARQEARQEAERMQAVLESERKLRQLADAMPQIVWMARPDGYTEYYNRRWYEDVDQTSDTAGHNWNSPIHPDDRQRAIDRWTQSIRTGEPYEVEYRFLGKDGYYRWYLGRALPVRDAEGQITSWYGTCTNINEQKQTETLLRKSEEDFRTLADNITQFAWTADPSGYIFWYNRRWYEYTGLSLAETQGWDWKKVHHPDYLQMVSRRWQQALAAGTPWEDTFPLRGQDGNYRWFLSRAVPIHDREGKIIRWFGTNTDVTVQRAAELALLDAQAKLEQRVAERTMELRNAREFLQAVLDNIEDGIVACNAEGVLTLFNRASREFHNQPVEMLSASEWTQRYNLYHGDGVTRMETEEVPLFRALRGEHVRDAEMVIAPKTGETRTLLASGQPLYDATGQQLGAVVSMHDITDRKRADNDLREFARQLQRSNDELEQFAYVASHDLQEPLRKIQAFGDRVLSGYRDNLDEQGQLYLSRMQAAAERMRGLINDLLSFSRVATRIKLGESVDLNHTVREVLGDLEGRIQEANALIHVDPLPTIEADPVQMHQLFQNLIANALKFRRQNVPPEIQITATLFSQSQGTMPGPFVELRVIDNGIGFEETYAQRIFELFQRLHTRSEFEGSGLGLAICRKIVERHGGCIFANSQAGAGATFIVRLPLSSSEEKTP